MRLLCLDIGSGTQDILLWDTAQPAENALQLVLPSPTLLVARKIEAATTRGEAIVLTGETMGGGACTGALRNHLRAGLQAYATPEAARPGISLVIGSGPGPRGRARVGRV